jgi:hypothetical protein
VGGAGLLDHGFGGFQGGEHLGRVALRRGGGAALAVERGGGVVGGAVEGVGVASELQFHRQGEVFGGREAEVVERGQGEGDELGDGDELVLAGGLVGGNRFFRGAAGEGGVGERAGGEEGDDQAEGELQQQVGLSHGAVVLAVTLRLCEAAGGR